MSRSAPVHATLNDWIVNDATPFSLDSRQDFHAAVEKVIGSLRDSVELLGFGEALHGGEEILLLRNRLFQRLVEAHGYSAIAVESSLPRGRFVNEFVSGNGPTSFEAVREAGFDHGFGRLEANRELVEWMRDYNADPSHRVKLRFYGFDMPTGTTRMASPSQSLRLVLDYLASMDSHSDAQKRLEQRRRIDALLGSDSDWENPAAYAEPTKSMGLTPSATALRLETEDLLTELRTRRPEWVANSDEDRYLEAMQYASVARELLNYHAAIARTLGPSVLLGIRDALMADNLASIVSRERGRGKVLAFAHNAHLQRGKAVFPWYTWWPAGSLLNQIFGSRYAVIGSAVGVSEANGIATPETDTLEARLTSFHQTALFIPTHEGQAFPAAELASLPTRSGSAKNLSYSPLTAQSFTDFDWLAVLQATTYNRGGPVLHVPKEIPLK